MNGFTEEQREAVMHKEGPMLVLAGPGSGKTTVITNRVFYLTNEIKVTPGNILVITFTKAAAVQMEERYVRLSNNREGRVNFGTFHAAFFKILRLAFGYTADNILKEEERLRLLRELIAENVNFEYTDEKELLETISGEISLVKNERIPPEYYHSISCPDDVFAQIYEKYRETLREKRLLDFDDMCVECFELLKKRPDILRQWQNKYTYILVDEFQDINSLQYDIVKLLAAPQNNLFVVGDDDQSIYGFRGAKPELMQRFARDYADMKTVTLSCNFRSTAPIVKASARLISNNRVRFDKKLYANETKGEPIEIRRYTDRKQTAAALAEEIAVLHRTGTEYREIAVLLRTNIQTRSFMGKFMEYNIPFQTRETVPCIYDHWICRDICAYLYLAYGSAERSLYLQVMNRPKRYLSREAFLQPSVDMSDLKKYYEGKDYVLDRIEKLEYDLSMIRKLNLFAAINYIRRSVGYDGFISEYANYRKMSAEDLFEILSDLCEDASEYTTFDEWVQHMTDFRTQLSAQNAKQKKNSPDAVTLTTYHSAKGLEYSTVFLPELNEDLTPYRLAVKPEDMEEERRMFYVAMTRAKRRLVLISMKELRMKTLEVSRFVREAMLDVKEYCSGTRIFHKTYGLGTILKNDKERITVKFDAVATEKSFQLAMCIAGGLISLANPKEE